MGKTVKICKIHWNYGVSIYLVEQTSMSSSFMVFNTVQPMVGSAVGFIDLINNKQFPKIRGYSKIHYLEIHHIYTIFLCGLFTPLPCPYHFCQRFHLNRKNHWSFKMIMQHSVTIFLTGIELRHKSRVCYYKLAMVAVLISRHGYSLRQPHYTKESYCEVQPSPSLAGLS